VRARSRGPERAPRVARARLARTAYRSRAVSMFLGAPRPAMPTRMGGTARGTEPELLNIRVAISPGVDETRGFDAVRGEESPASASAGSRLRACRRACRPGRSLRRCRAGTTVGRDGRLQCRRVAGARTASNSGVIPRAQVAARPVATRKRPASARSRAAAADSSRPSRGRGARPRERPPERQERDERPPGSNEFHAAQVPASGKQRAGDGRTML